MAYGLPMEWRDLTESDLFAGLKARNLPHPTNSAFHLDAWKEAILALGVVGPRDSAIAHAAAFYGREIADLRAYALEALGPGLSRPRALRMLAALANQQYLTLRAKFEAQVLAAAGDGPAHLEQLGQLLIPSSAGQSMTADDHVTTLVDSLAIRLFEIWRRPDVLDTPEPADPIANGLLAFKIASVELGYRDLWQHVLWGEHALSKTASGIYVDAPTDRELAKRWLLWTLRQDNLAAWERHMDAGAAVYAGKALRPVDPVVTRTVVRLKRGPNGRRKFVTGPSDGRRGDQRNHVAERDMLERLYTGLFLDEPLPKLGDGDLTCRELSKAWWVVEDLARLIVAELGRPWFNNDQGVGRFAIPVDIDDIARAVADSLQIDTARARTILGVFTSDPADTSSLFAKGLWATPLLPAPGDRRYIILAPLLVGSPIKRVETWLEIGGISDHSGLKGKGKPFEAHVRTHLAEALAENETLEAAVVGATALKRKDVTTEEIDLLIRVGDTVLVGEVKCFVAPSEPLQKSNYLRRLGEATTQARTKVDWAKVNRHQVAAELGVTAENRIDRLIFLPLVVLNQSYGVGLSRNGVPIVDLHYLSLVLGSGSYQGETWFEKETGMSFETVELYADQAEFEAKVESLLAAPPAIERYLGMIGWRRFPFGWREQGRVLIEATVLNGPPV